MAMNAIAIIPARGGSKGLPGKNLAQIGGASLLEWAATAALGVTGLRIYVSTEDEQIRKAVLALPAGVIDILRPAALAQDHTPDLPVAEDLLEGLEGEAIDDDDALVWLRPTAPFRQAADIEEILNVLDAHPEVDSVRSVLPVRDHPLKTYRIAGEVGTGIWRLAPWSPAEHRANHPRQFLPPAWRACGWIDAVRVRCVRVGSMEGDVIAGWPVPFPGADRGIEIDDEIDLERAREIAGRRRWRPGCCP